MNIATHKGIVTEINPGQVRVKIEVPSACGHCEAKGKCGFADGKEREVDIATMQWEEFHIREQVEVQIDQSLGFEAVLWAYFLPALLLIAAIILLNRFVAEWLAIIITLAIISCYYVILYLYRKKLQKKFSFSIKSLE